MGDPRVQPLEIWQLVLGSGDILSRAVRRRPECLLEGLALLQQGTGQTRDGRTAHRSCVGYQHLVIGGGRAADVPDAVLAQRPTPFTRLPDLFIGEAGGLALASRLGFHPTEVLVLDVGQTSIKASYDGRRCRLERDLTRLPRGRVSERRRPEEQRRALRDWIAAAIQEVTSAHRMPLAMICALPGEVAADGTPGRSTYAAAADDRSLLPDVLLRVGIKPKALGILNDAELAAISASLLPESTGRTLVITLGFGLGAALLAEPSP